MLAYSTCSIFETNKAYITSDLINSKVNGRNSQRNGMLWLELINFSSILHLIGRTVFMNWITLIAITGGKYIWSLVNGWWLWLSSLVSNFFIQISCLAAVHVPADVGVSLNSNSWTDLGDFLITLRTVWAHGVSVSPFPPTPPWDCTTAGKHLLRIWCPPSYWNQWEACCSTYGIKNASKEISDTLTKTCFNASPTSKCYSVCPEFGYEDKSVREDSCLLLVWFNLS